jgi:hypothetical protein
MGNNGKNGKTPLKEREKQRLIEMKEIVNNEPKGIIFSKEEERQKYYDEKAEKLVREKVRDAQRTQTKRLLGGPAYFKEFLEEVVTKDSNILYAFVVGSFADDKNYKEIMKEYNISEITEEDLAKIRIPKDIDILIVYEDEIKITDESAYLRDIEKKAPKIKNGGDSNFKYEVHGVSIEKFYDYVNSDYSKIKDMTPEQIAEFKKDVSRRHEFQVPVSSIKIYQKCMPGINKETDKEADMENYKMMNETEMNLEKIREKTGHPRTMNDYMQFWTFFAARAKEVFPDDFKETAEEYIKYSDVYSV